MSLVDPIPEYLIELLNQLEDGDTFFVNQGEAVWLSGASTPEVNEILGDKKIKWEIQPGLSRAFIRKKE